LFYDPPATLLALLRTVELETVSVSGSLRCCGPEMPLPP
jgi:hypothetical protein